MGTLSIDSPNTCRHTELYLFVLLRYKSFSFHGEAAKKIKIDFSDAARRKCLLN